MRHRAVVASGGVALLLAVGYLLAPPMGTDLSAQVARADFIREYGFRPIDFRWYGGTVQYGYSIVSPAVMAVLGPRPAGALAAVVSSLALAALLVHSGARRPVLGGMLGAFCFFGNLVSGRVTFALGVAFGLLALLSLVSRRRSVRLAGGGLGAALAAVTSPVAGLFVVLAGVSLVLARGPLLPAGRPRRVLRELLSRTEQGTRSLLSRMDGLVLAAPALLALAVVGLLFGDGGWMNISRSDTLHATVTSLAVALLVPRRAVRIGAVLSAAGVLAAFAVHTPVGLNATRLATMFALPVVAGYARLPGAPPPYSRPPAWLTATVVLVGLALWQPPVLPGDLAHAGDPTADRSYFAPLLAELRRRGVIGRIEVPPTSDYWESAYVAGTAPLARGWLRQVDLARNGLFFDGSLTAETYHSWLRDNGVSYVALPDAEPSWVARREAELVRSGPSYLKPVWQSPHWTLYQVVDASSIVDGARLATVDGASVTFDAERPGDVLVRVRWFRWLTVSGPVRARLAPAAGGWTVVRVPEPGRYTVRSGDG